MPPRSTAAKTSEPPRRNRARRRVRDRRACARPGDRDHDRHRRQLRRCRIDAALLAGNAVRREHVERQRDIAPGRQRRAPIRSSMFTKRSHAGIRITPGNGPGLAAAADAPSRRGKRVERNEHLFRRARRLLGGTRPASPAANSIAAIAFSAAKLAGRRGDIALVQKLVQRAHQLVGRADVRRVTGIDLHIALAGFALRAPGELANVWPA